MLKHYRVQRAFSLLGFAEYANLAIGAKANRNYPHKIEEPRTK